MKKYLLILVLFISGKAFTNDFFFEGKMMPTVSYKKVAWINKGCTSCMAINAISYVKIPKDSGPSYIGTPGSKVCTSLPDTKVAIFKSKAGEQGFCVFKDSSYIDTGGLFYFARENTNKKK